MPASGISLRPVIIVLLLIATILVGVGSYAAYQEFRTAPISPTPTEKPFTCPKTPWVDCMPGPDRQLKRECTQEYLTWAKANCPNFEGAAL
jgi:hypothetical protein